MGEESNWNTAQRVFWKIEKMREAIFIEIDRKKMIFRTVLYSVLGLFVFLGFYYLGEWQDWVSSTVFKVIAVLSLLFFIVVAGTFAKNIKNGAAGLTIDKTGITDETSSISNGLIKWKEINEISKVKTTSSKLILIHVKKPQRFIDNAKNGAIKRLLNQNYTLYKTPIVINVSALTTTLSELEEVLVNFLGKSGKKK